MQSLWASMEVFRCREVQDEGDRVARLPITSLRSFHSFIQTLMLQSLILNKAKRMLATLVVPLLRFSFDDLLDWRTVGT
jgi:hypothetical protein